jgi:hypothetical protein
MQDRGTVNAKGRSRDCCFKDWTKVATILIGHQRKRATSSFLLEPSVKLRAAQNALNCVDAVPYLSSPKG